MVCYVNACIIIKFPLCTYKTHHEISLPRLEYLHTKIAQFYWILNLLKFVTYYVLVYQCITKFLSDHNSKTYSFNFLSYYKMNYSLYVKVFIYIKFLYWNNYETTKNIKIPPVVKNTCKNHYNHTSQKHLASQHNTALITLKTNFTEHSAVTSSHNGTAWDFESTLTAGTFNTYLWSTLFEAIFYRELFL